MAPALCCVVHAITRGCKLIQKSGMPPRPDYADPAKFVKFDEAIDPDQCLGIWGSQHVTA